MKAKIDEIEKEAKCLLTREEHLLLLTHFKSNSENALKIVNHYMDTMHGLQIIHKLPPGTTLRIRDTADSLLQLKLPQPDRTTEEYKDILDNESQSILLSEGIMPSGNVRSKLEELGISGLYTHLGSLTTYRVELTTSYFGAKVFLDECIYPDGFVDYEIEVESGSLAWSEKVLAEILKVVSVTKIVAISKFQRFLDRIAA